MACIRLYRHVYFMLKLTYINRWRWSAPLATPSPAAARCQQSQRGLREASRAKEQRVRVGRDVDRTAARRTRSHTLRRRRRRHRSRGRRSRCRRASRWWTRTRCRPPPPASSPWRRACPRCASTTRLRSPTPCCNFIIKAHVCTAPRSPHHGVASGQGRRCSRVQLKIMTEDESYA